MPYDGNRLPYDSILGPLTKAEQPLVVAARMLRQLIPNENGVKVAMSRSSEGSPTIEDAYVAPWFRNDTIRFIPARIIPIMDTVINTLYQGGMYPEDMSDPITEFHTLSDVFTQFAVRKDNYCSGNFCWGNTHHKMQEKETNKSVLHWFDEAQFMQNFHNLTSTIYPDMYELSEGDPFSTLYNYSVVRYVGDVLENTPHWTQGEGDKAVAGLLRDGFPSDMLVMLACMFPSVFADRDTYRIELTEHHNLWNNVSIDMFYKYMITIEKATA